jgi:hypothetical protein
MVRLRSERRQLGVFWGVQVAAVMVITCVICLVWALPVGASDQDELTALKTQVKALMQRIDQLEKKQVEAPPSNVKVGWKDGFHIDYKDAESDNEYKFRFRTGFNMRYTYVLTDDDVVHNTENYSSFTARRLRFYVDGTAPNKDWQYFMHVQLEPQSAVNTHDAYIQWQKYHYARIQFGRMKIPYSMEFWQSGFMQNGTDRTIFTGDSEMDKDIFGTQTYDIPSDNARLRVGNQIDKNNGFPTGGMVIYRSQGVNLNGYVDMFGQKDFFTYWLGVYNGRDTQASANIDDQHLYSFRVGVNFLPGSDPKGPMGPYGFNNYFMQGDYGHNTVPLAAFVFGGFTNHDKVQKYYTGINIDESNINENKNNSGPTKPGVHDTGNYGFDAAFLFRYMGFSADLEAGWEEFIQDPDGSALDMEQTWDRFAARINLGYFFVPRKWEVVLKAAYFERIMDNNLEDSLQSGLGLVLLDDGYAVEDNLQQCRFGVNYYLHGFNQYISADVAWLRREFKKIKASEAADPDVNFGGALSSDPADQDDFSFRVAYQFLF